MKKIIFFTKDSCLNGRIFGVVQHTNDFALYTEAIKFFNHSETMVRIAVRTITLNVYRGKKLYILSNQLNAYSFIMHFLNNCHCLCICIFCFIHKMCSFYYYPCTF